jgi:hypothetical protein
MGGYFPGPLGFAAFAGVKFGGYALAGIALKKLQPAITGSALKIAALRTGLGVVLGPPITLLGGMIVGLLLAGVGRDMPTYFCYVFLLRPLRILIWALVLYIFTRRIDLSASRFWGYAAMGATWSCLLDWPGFKLAMVAPGKIPVC